MTDPTKIITALSALEDDVRALRAQVSAVRRALEGATPTPVTNEIRNEYQAAGPLAAVQPIPLPGGFVAVPEFGIGATSPAGYRVERRAAEDADRDAQELPDREFKRAALRLLALQIALRNPTADADPWDHADALVKAALTISRSRATSPSPGAEPAVQPRADA